MDSNLMIVLLLVVLVMVGILYTELCRKDKEILRLEVLNMKLKAELRLVDDVCDDTVECEYNYHDPVHSDVCHFECMLDANLEFNDRLTPKAQEYRDKLIVGVERMMKKVEDYKNSQ